MRVRLGLLVAAVALAQMLFIARLVRRRQLREKYAMLWMTVGAVVVAITLIRGPIDRMAKALGVTYPPSILFLIGIMFLLTVVAHLSWEVSRLEEKTRRLAEEVALMQVERPEGPPREAPAGDPAT
jgi:hypothetical protein